ncbi:MAG: heme-binding domain-containing protein [Lachnospiraceae bacterium]|nr:heme-binding domain-containing protein [Lachnospiraceae bacterium]
MKNKKLIAIPVVLVVAIIVYAAIMLSGRAITADNLNDQFVQVIENNGCLQCHAADPEPFWYQKMPLVSSLFEKDMTNGYRSVDLEKVVAQIQAGETVNIADVSKIEQATLNNDMPIIEYSAVHWGSNLNASEQQIVMDWVAGQRTTYVQGIAEEIGYEMDEATLAAAISEPVQIMPNPSDYDIDPEKAELGLALFHDTRLSADLTVSCATCHPLNNGGVDGSQFAKGIASQVGGINAPSVYNAVFNVQQFWNGRAATLADQAAGPPLNPVEMGHESFDDIVALLEADEEMVKAFEKVYGNEGISQATITGAIEEFERLLVTPNSRFDQYLAGDTGALTAEEIEGYELFKKNYCATCHVGVSMGGQSFEKLGTVVDAAVYYEERGTEISGDDQGLYGFTGNEEDMYKFKVPNLRNIELTAPYMHDGTHMTMEEAVRTMFRFNTANPEPTDDTVNKIVAFMKTLTGENEYMDYVNVPSNKLGQ